MNPDTRSQALSPASNPANNLSDGKPSNFTGPQVQTFTRKQPKQAFQRIWFRHNRTMAGYSGTPLPKKLGIKEGMDVVILDSPTGFDGTLGELPEGVEVNDKPGAADVFVIFSTQAADMDRKFHEAMGNIPPDGAIWVAWPKRSSGVDTDLTEDRMRELFLPTGMVDNKVCAIDEIWSGLRFVVRTENRPTWVSAK